MNAYKRKYTQYKCTQYFDFNDGNVLFLLLLNHILEILGGFL